MENGRMKKDRGPIGDISEDENEDFSEYNQELYVKHPPKKITLEKNYQDIDDAIEALRKKIGPHYILDLDLPLGVHENFYFKKSDFNKYKNSEYVIEAFLTAHQAGVYPPIWVLSYLSEIFKDWKNSQGTKSLDQLLRLKPSRGGTPFFKKRANEKRDYWLCRVTFTLNTLFEFSIENACKLSIKGSDDLEDFGAKKPTATTFEATYKAWKKESISLGEAEFLTNLNRKMSRQDKIVFLNQFLLEKIMCIKNKKGKNIKDLIYDLHRGGAK